MFLQNRCRIYQCELCVGSPANSLTTAGGQIRSSITFSSVHADPKLFLPTDDGLQNGPGQHRNLQGTLTPSEFPSQKHKFFALFFLKIGPEADSGPAHGSKYSRAKGKKNYFLKWKLRNIQLMTNVIIHPEWKREIVSRRRRLGSLDASWHWETLLAGSGVGKWTQMSECLCARSSASTSQGSHWAVSITALLETRAAAAAAQWSKPPSEKREDEKERQRSCSSQLISLPVDELRHRLSYPFVNV